MLGENRRKPEDRDKDLPTGNKQWYERSSHKRLTRGTEQRKDWSSRPDQGPTQLEQGDT